MRVCVALKDADRWYTPYAYRSSATSPAMNTPMVRDNVKLWHQYSFAVVCRSLPCCCRCLEGAGARGAGTGGAGRGDRGAVMGERPKGVPGGVKGEGSAVG